MGQGKSKKCNGYYLSGVFDTDEGVVFPDDYSKRSGKDGYFQYKMTAVTGIRK